MLVPIFTLPLHSQIRREFSSAGSEHLPYKQRVGGSNPSTPTKQSNFGLLFLFNSGDTKMLQKTKNPNNLLIIGILLYSKPGSNRHGHYWPQDFKSGVSTYSTIRATAFLSVRHGKSSKIISMCKPLIYIFDNLFSFRGVKPLDLLVSPEPSELAFGISA